MPPLLRLMLLRLRRRMRPLLLLRLLRLLRRHLPQSDLSPVATQRAGGDAGGMRRRAIRTARR
jgi:hypothetical protein